MQECSSARKGHTNISKVDDTSTTLLPGSDAKVLKNLRRLPWAGPRPGPGRVGVKSLLLKSLETHLEPKWPQQNHVAQDAGLTFCLDGVILRNVDTTSEKLQPGLS